MGVQIARPSQNFSGITPCQKFFYEKVKKELKFSKLVPYSLRMAMEDDFSGFNLDGHTGLEDACAEVEAAPPSAGSESFAALQARTMRALSSARVELEGKAVAALVATLTIASARQSARLVARVLTVMAKAIPPADLFAAATLPAASAGHNLTPRIVPSPRP